jgi:hypothetical protein
MKIIIPILCSILFLVGCDKEISLVLDNNNPTLVIDASVTDQTGPYFVQLSLSTPVTNSTNIGIISGAC